MASKELIDAPSRKASQSGASSRTQAVIPAPRRIVPLHTAVQGVAAPPGLTYGGGPLISNVQVSVIFWGAAWNQPAQAALIPQVNAFFDYILTSSIIDLLSQYSVPGKPIGYGHRAGTTQQTTTEPGGGSGNVTDAQIQQAIQGWINAGAVPAPNANTLYFVYLPPNVSATDPQGDASCTQMCGYHWYIAGTNPEIHYAVMPFPGCGGCLGSLTTIQALTSTSSHELCESITDPQPWSGWNDSVNGEIGDICAWQTQVLGGFTVQKEWSNGQHVCAITGLGTPTNAYLPVYAQGDPGLGIGGYDLKSTADRAFAFDYDSSGKLDHLALYRPGTGTIWILKNTNGNFAPVYHQGDPGLGIGGYDLKSPADLAFAFDYDSSGKMDHLALYRPATGTMWILKNTNGFFSPVYHQGDPGLGIGGYDLRSSADRAFAFDYDSSGKLDHMALYRPGTGTMWILKNTNGNFAPVYHQGDPGLGIGGYDLKSPADRAFAFDYDGSGKLDHIALYRPGTGTIWILTNTNGNFAAAYHQGDPGLGIGGYDLRSPADLAFAFDYASQGKLNYLSLYRPATGTIWILKKQ